MRDVVTRVVDNAKAYAKAEIAVVRATIADTAGRWRLPAILFVVALLLVQAALTVLVGAVGMTVAIWLGPAAGLACGALIGLALAGLLVWIAVGRLSRERS